MRAHQFRRIIAILIVGLFFMQSIPAKPVSAAASQTAYYKEIGEKLEHWANKYNIPPVLLKAIAWMESGWKQYELDPTTGLPLTDKPLIGRDGIGIGIMQISSYSPTDTEEIEKLKNDIDYNIEIGCQMLNQKWRAYPKIGDGDRNVLENWYFAVWGYNSWATRNNPNVLTGKSAYQDSVFSLMGQKYNSAITFAPGATKISKSLLPPVNPPYFASRWSTPTPKHLGDLVIDPDLLISSGGGPGAHAANGDYWFKYARWSSYYALGFYVTAYKSPEVTDKSVSTQKILSAYGKLIAEADALMLEGKDSSYVTAAKYYWTVYQGPNLDSAISERANKGHLSALSKVITEADKLLLQGTGQSYLTASQDYGVVLQGSDLDPDLVEKANTGLLKTYEKLLAEADKLALEGSSESKASASKYYLTVLEGPVLDASLAERAKIGYDLTRNVNTDPSSPIYDPSRGNPTPTPTPAPTPTPTPTPTPDPDPINIERLYGTRAEDTAIKISQEGWEDNSSPVVLLARVDRFQDALAAAPLAKKLNAPLLLTSPYQLDKAVLQELKRLGASEKIYVIGGEGAITKPVTNALDKEDFSYERIFGDSAADTAAAIARKIGPSTQVILASSKSFPDALSASAPAAALGIPILLTEQGKLPTATKQILKDFEVTKTIIVGGKFAISTTFDAEGGPLASYGPLRLAGETKYDTMLQIVKHFNQDPQSLVIATGENFPDGLSGGAFAALNGSPMILIPKGDLNLDTRNYLKGLSGTTTNAYILGGTGVITSTSEKIIGDLLTQ
ncbi:cell wall-binding repeat-containing protein [Desulfosporosinus sp.]|uniref:cell wall-binding repeat-containing protein n=1 Tax=Desulfosporosinus sp. TaxID=157907 RepID=UPI0025BA0418|nr:cell wall-binding repeat-containing protein [Desulfosporosinus sp.]MBC2721492.1 cell wall-binding repeat-containing protein [Desulfosporosinus sp.]MBC2726367.1 cell wall-binding repeat-containing protein [Desulfosporosinus sp.]